MTSATSMKDLVNTEEKTSIEALKTILHLSKGTINVPLTYGRWRTDMISLAWALIEHGYDPVSLSNDLWEYLADDDLSEFLSPRGASFHRIAIVKGITPKYPLNWGDAAKRFQKSKFLMTLLENWTRRFFNDMCIPMMAKGRTPTPSEGGETARRNQWKLKRNLLSRDGWFSPVGRVMDSSAPDTITPIGDNGSDSLEAAHIIPFSSSRNLILTNMLSKFAGEDLQALLSDKINDPSNALLLTATAHKAFDAFKFGFENQDGRYLLRFVAPIRQLPGEVLRHAENEEIVFATDDPRIAKPSCLLCNIHVAVGRVLWASGAAEVIAKMLEDEEEIKSGNFEDKYWFQVSASYLQRQLRALQDLDQNGRCDPVVEENLSTCSHQIDT
ncbi:hypothetical protein V1517DRAFT_327549 [Lipomyces orientalis]|uniref:Uncharacterized protein n=1 Tax=Lipomyces orientalis TaxID=1233043 RepID=A0ACC3TIP8_9ASCO